MRVAAWHPRRRALRGRADAGVTAATGRDRHDSSRTYFTGLPLTQIKLLTDRLCIAALVFLAAPAAAPLASAQTSEPQSLLAGRRIPVAERATEAPVLQLWDTAARLEELEKWMEDFSAWKDWASTWGNRREPGWFSSARSRRPRPDPPLWLFQDCDGVALDGREEACQLLAEWNAGPAAITQTPPAQVASKNAEDEPKTTWWEHVHLDAGWPAVQTGTGAYGVLGLHATTTVKGRFQVFVAPGAMLLNVPTVDGSRAWRLATNYGIAYRLGQFTIPGTSRQAYLHLNIAKAWLFSAGPSVPSSSTDFVGLSVTFKKTQ